MTGSGIWFETSHADLHAHDFQGGAWRRGGLALPLADHELEFCGTVVAVFYKEK